MKTFCTLLLAFFVLGLVNANAAPRLKHVVSFKFKESATPQQIKQVVSDFAALKRKIPQMKDFEWGINVSPEKLSKGYTHCFIATFKTAKDRDAYLVHPAHKAFAQGLGPVLDEAFVIDFWANK